jgi:hypothetical protein
MGRTETVMWVCDTPTCTNSEQKTQVNKWDEAPPTGWSHVQVLIEGETLENEDCDCKCHDYDLDEEDDWDEDSTPGWHDESDCECQSEEAEDRGDFHLCKECTHSLKHQFIRPKKGTLI